MRVRARPLIPLHFLDPTIGQSEQRTFDVSIQGQPVLQGMNVAQEAKGTNRAIVREFKGIQADRSLTIDLKAISGLTLLSGVEIVAEE